MYSDDNKGMNEGIIENDYIYINHHLLIGSNIKQLAYNI